MFKFDRNYFFSTHFLGPAANWLIVLSGVSDLASKGPEVISMPMTSSLCVYSALFMRFAWQVQPRNHLLLACHMFNEGVQLTQLYRGYMYQLGQDAKEDSFKQNAIPKTTPAQTDSLQFTPFRFASFLAAGGALTAAGPSIKERLMTSASVPKQAKFLFGHPAGPFTIHFWAPTWKWMLSVSNLMDYDRPVDTVSTSQQAALCATGFIWTRYATVITPVNWNLFVVNLTLATTGVYHLGRKFNHTYQSPEVVS